MLDKIILGFLNLKELTAYDIKKALDNSVNHFYTTSYGSIHPALVKLKKGNYIESRQEQKGGRLKKIYTIRESGRTLFFEWLNSNIVPSRMKENAVVHLFFFGLLGEENRERIVKNYMESIEQQIAVLQNLKNEVGERISTLPEEFLEIARFQNETLEYGIDQADFTRRWFTELYSNRLK